MSLKKVEGVFIPNCTRKNSCEYVLIIYMKKIRDEIIIIIILLFTVADLGILKLWGVNWKNQSIYSDKSPDGFRLPFWLCLCFSLIKMFTSGRQICSWLCPWFIRTECTHHTITQRLCYLGLVFDWPFETFFHHWPIRLLGFLHLFALNYMYLFYALCYLKTAEENGEIFPCKLVVMKS